MKSWLYMIFAVTCYLTQACTPAAVNISPGITSSPTLSPTVTSSMPDQSPGNVTITYKFNRQLKIASNQFAVWIEDEDGNYIRTLYATRFTASGGYKQRPESLPMWIEASDWKNTSKEEADALTGATQSSGAKTVAWDCKDRIGKAVKPGKYIYIIEGNIYWNDRVVWRGEIEIGSEESTSQAEVSYIPETAKNSGVLIENVSAVFKPGE